MKLCIRCLQYLPLEAFHKERREADGRNTHCKECEKERARVYYEQHRDERTAYQREYGKRCRALRRERLSMRSSA